ncbi:MAG: tetratricopeptide repeat protein, partial [Nitrospiraceae bacterium]
MLLLVTGCTLPEVRTAEQLAAQGNWDGAVVAYRAALKKDPFDQSIQEHLKQAQRRAADSHAARARQLLKDDRLAEALQEFKLALSLDPARREHHLGFGDVMRLKEARVALREANTLRNLGRLEEAIEAYERAVELDPDLTPALEAITTISARILSDEAIGGSTQPITLRFQNARLKEVFEILARAVGINVIFDKDLRDDSVTVFIKDTPFPEALNMILTTHNLFATRIGPDTLLISPDTKQKKARYQDLMIRTFYLSNLKAKDMVNLLRTMLESKRVYVNEKLNAVVIRAEPAKLQLAERMIMANDRRDSEVELEVEVLEVNRTKIQKFGLNYAKSAGVGIFPPGFTGALSTGPTQFTFEELKNLGDATVLFTLPSSLLLDFLKTESDAKTLAAPKIRVVNNGKATINIGDKQPILLSTTNVLPGQAATGAVPTTSTVTSIEFKDTGIKLTVEPTIHLMDELTLKLKIEVTRLGDLVTLQADPPISQFRFGTRTAETTLNMKDGETVVLAGLIQDENRKTRVSVPWLGDIPWIGDLFSSIKEDTITTEVILTITPHIIRNVTPPSMATQAFWSGTATNFATKPLFSGVTRRTSLTPWESAPAPVSLQA